VKGAKDWESQVLFSIDFLRTDVIIEFRYFASDESSFILLQ